MAMSTSRRQPAYYDDETLLSVFRLHNANIARCISKKVSYGSPRWSQEEGGQGPLVHVRS